MCAVLSYFLRVIFFIFFVSNTYTRYYEMMGNFPPHEHFEVEKWTYSKSLKIQKEFFLKEILA